MGEVPDWFPICLASISSGTAPWILANAPDTAGAYCWIVWLNTTQHVIDIQNAKRNPLK